jgi:hypothetical protein
MKSVLFSAEDDPQGNYNWNIVENGVKHHDPLGYLQCTYLFGTHIFWHFVRHRSVQLFLVPSGHFQQYSSYIVAS